MNCVSTICCDIWYYVAPNNFSCLTIFCYKLCYFVLCASALGCAGWRSEMIFIADCLWTSRCLSLRIGMLETAWMLQVIMRLAGWTAVKQFNGAHDRWYVLWIYELNDNCWGRNLDIIGFFLYGSILLCDDDYETIPMLYNVFNVNNVNWENPRHLDLDIAFVRSSMMWYKIYFKHPDACHMLETPLWCADVAEDGDNFRAGSVVNVYLLWRDIWMGRPVGQNQWAYYLKIRMIQILRFECLQLSKSYMWFMAISICM